jgi:hypothetical protein
MVVTAGVGTTLNTEKRPMAAIDENVRLVIEESLLEEYG